MATIISRAIAIEGAHTDLAQPIAPADPSNEPIYGLVAPTNAGPCTVFIGTNGPSGPAAMTNGAVIAQSQEYQPGQQIQQEDGFYGVRLDYLNAVVPAGQAPKVGATLAAQLEGKAALICDMGAGSGFPTWAGIIVASFDQVAVSSDVTVTCDDLSDMPAWTAGEPLYAEGCVWTFVSATGNTLTMTNTGRAAARIEWSA